MLKTKRRHFVVAACGLGASLAAAAWRNPLPTFVRSRDTEHTCSRASHALGTKVSITLIHADRQQAESALDAAFYAIEEVEAHLSIYRADSQLSRLNRSGRLRGPHRDLIEVLACAAEVSLRSEGAFDVTVQPLWECFASAQRSGRLPTTEELEQARRLVDWRRVEADSDEVRLRGQGCRITLNGIAQGYAADRALAALQRHGIEHALIDTGELAALGDKSADTPWKVGLQHPRHADAFLAIAALKDRCLSTSGDYATTFSTDRRFHHVFDPATGRSPHELASVSVAAPTAMQADAWSTALFVLGTKRGMEMLGTLPDHDALFVLKDGSSLATPGFPLAGEGVAS